jgi:WXG100 family type VII secretion target
MSDDGMLVVKFGALEQASADIERAYNKLEAQLAQLERDAEPLVATWRGDAQAAYTQRRERWRRAADDLKSILRDIKIAVDESAQDYRTTEKKATSLFQ